MIACPADLGLPNPATPDAALTAAELATIAAVDLWLLAAEQWVHEATGRRYPGICRAILQICTGDTCSCSCACAKSRCGWAAINLGLTHPLLTVDANDAPITATTIHPGQPVPTIGGVTFAVAVSGTSSIRPVGGCGPWPPQSYCATGCPPWAVEVAFGALPPRPVVEAAVRLGTIWAQAACIDNTCALPAGTTSYRVHDTVVEVAPAKDVVASRRTTATLADGWQLPIVDDQLIDLLLTPYTRRAPARRTEIWSPDLPEIHRIRPADVAGCWP